MVAFFDALVTGSDATDLSDLDAAELNDIDSYLSSTTQMGACTDADIWKILCADNESDPTYSCGSRPNKQVRFIADPDFLLGSTLFRNLRHPSTQKYCHKTWLDKTTSWKIDVEWNIGETHV